MSYYEPSSLYGLGPGELGDLREKTRWDSGVHVDQDYWSLLGPCQVATVLRKFIAIFGELKYATDKLTY